MCVCMRSNIPNSFGWNFCGNGIVMDWGIFNNFVVALFSQRAQKRITFVDDVVQQQLSFLDTHSCCCCRCLVRYFICGSIMFQQLIAGITHPPRQPVSHQTGELVIGVPIANRELTTRVNKKIDCV